jgi:hypothetical protein
MSTRRLPARRIRAAWRTGRRGQALVETALVLPVLVVLLVGAAQIGAIAYGLVSADSAAREGALSGVNSPIDSLTAASTSPGQTYACHAWQSSYDTVETNPICQTAYDSAGGLLKGSMTVTVTALTTGLSRNDTVPDDVVQVRNGCTGIAASVSGTVSNIPTLQTGTTVRVSTPSVSVNAASGGGYTLCTSPGSQTLSATATDSQGCTWGTQTTIAPAQKATLTVNLSLVQQGCPSSSTSTSTSSSTTTSGTTTSVTNITSSTSSSVCASPPAQYFAVVVTYKVPVFIPFLDHLLGDPGDNTTRTVTTSVTMDAAPCTVTGGN